MYLSKTATAKRLGLKKTSDVDILVRSGVLIPIKQERGSAVFSKVDIDRAKKMLSGTHPDYSAMLLSLADRLARVETAVSIMSNVVKPSISDVLYGIDPEDLVSRLLKALTASKPLSVPQITELLKIMTNLDQYHLEKMEEAKLPTPISGWSSLLRRIASELQARQDILKKDPPGYKLLRSLLKSAQTNLSQLALLETGRETVVTEHPRMVVGRIIASKRASSTPQKSFATQHQ